MINLVFTALVSILVIWLVARLVTWLVLRKLNSSHRGLEVKIGGVGLLTLGGVQIKLGHILVEIDKIWLSSSYLSSDIRRPLAVCAGNVRIHVQLHDPASHPEGQGSVGGGHTSQGQGSSEKLKLVFSYLQMLGVYIDTLNVIMVKSGLTSCMLHNTFHQVALDVVAANQSCQCSVSIETAHAKVFKSNSDPSMVVSSSQPCLAGVEFSTQVSICGSLQTRQLEEMYVSLTRPHISVTEGLMEQIAEWRQDKETSQTQLSEATSASPMTDAASILSQIPKALHVKIEDAEAMLEKEAVNRSLTLKVPTVRLDLQHDVVDTQPDSHQGKLNIVIKDATGGSARANLLNMGSLHTTLEVTEDAIDWTTNFRSCFLGYHHEEVFYWLSIIDKMRPGQEEVMGPGQEEVNQSAATSCPKPSVDLVTRAQEKLGNKTLKVAMEMNSASAAVAMAATSGIKAGLSQLKFTSQFKSVGYPDCKVDLEVTHVYCKLGDKAASAGELSPKLHHWNTLMYTGLLILKANQTSSQASMDTIVDSVQLEISTTALSVISQLTSAVQRSLPRSSQGHKEVPRRPVPAGGKQGQGLLARMGRGTQLNVECSNVNVFVCNDLKVCSMLRLDSSNLQLKYDDVTLVLQGAKAQYMKQDLLSHPLVRSHDIGSPVFHLHRLEATYGWHTKQSSVRILEELSVTWSTALHMSILTAVQDVKDLVAKVSGLQESSQVPPPVSQTSKSAFEAQVDILVKAHIALTLKLSRGHCVSCNTRQLNIQVNPSKTSLRMSVFNILFDQHHIFTVEGTYLHSDHHSPQLKMERESLGPLQKLTNHARVLDFEKFEVVFPYGYDFADCVEELKNLNKWRKLVHKVKRSPFTAESPLPPDLVIRAQSVIVQLSDDPFEVKLADNFELLCDEKLENEKRLSAMDRRIQELRKKHLHLPADKIENLYASLGKKSAEVYIQRSRQLYATSPMRTNLFTWSMSQLEIIALADTSFHGKDNVVKHMCDIDKESPYPEEGLDFTILWCRMMNASVANWTCQMRDYPMKMLEVEDMHVWGRLICAEQAGTPRAKRQCSVEVAPPWGDALVERSMPPVKFYHDFSCDVTTLNMAYGACLEASIGQFNLSQNLVNRPSVDPSHPLPFWDKSRLFLHGRWTMSVQRMSWLYPASLDPYNTTEVMDWTWSNLILDWTNAKWVFQGDLDIYARTASKYDECRVLHLPNFKLCVLLDWVCLGDPNDHHSVMPCAPDKIPEFSMQEHDSFRAFRSQNLNVSLTFETKPCSTGDVPSCRFYASTLRWMDKVKMCIARVSRPVRRGTYYKTVTPHRQQFSRHYRNLKFSFSIHQFQVLYWASFAKQHGMELHGKHFNLGAGLTLTLVPTEDGLCRRPQTNWRIREFNSELNEVTIWLCSSQREKSQDKPGSKREQKNFFFSVTRVSYQRAEETEVLDASQTEEVDEQATHRVQIHNLKAAWTVDNRNVAFSLYDGYSKSSMLKKNLSSEALKGFKVDTSQTPQKLNKSGTATSPPVTTLNTPSPLTRLQRGSMLHKLVSESDSKFVAVHEEVSEGGLTVDQLHGIRACQNDDVVHRMWHIELYNSQVMLRGCETRGYVIVSSPKSSVLSCDHRPTWKSQQLKSKRTWVGSLECLQYYATVDYGKEFSVNNIRWLNLETIEERSESPQSMMGIHEMMGSGQCVGGVVNSAMGVAGEEEGRGVQLQRIISRCRCQFFYAGYGEVEDETVPEVPLPPADSESVMMRSEEGVDSFTVLHHDLNVCTNSLQYAMILDIVNNLILYVEPRKKDLTEKLQNMRFTLQLARSEDLRTPIFQRQNNLREQLLSIRRLERQLYLLQKSLDDEPETEELMEQRQSVEEELETLKEQLLSASEELAIMVSCFKESQLLLKEQRKATKTKKESSVVRRQEVCFKHAEWRMTEADGQIGIADLVLRNFLYTKVNKEDESGSHQLELGWVKVTNLLPNTLYKEVLGIQEQSKSFTDRQLMLRILCTFKAPVGGIAIKEHVEVNVLPITIQVTKRFYTAVMAFFFPGKNVDAEDDDEDDVELGPGLVKAPGKGKDDNKKEERSQRRSIRRRGNHSNIDDIDKMKERAAKNNMFLFVKIPEVPLKVSYKGLKDKNITDVHDFNFLLPTLEYHSQTWTWLDLLLAVKNDSKKVLIHQAIKQKLHMKSRTGDGTLRNELQEEQDKARMLLGAKLLGEKPSHKKSLFSKSSKS